ncbi:MAG TPA: YHS domain-containing protein [Novimethylophilus sp.]|jgi:YHS domain-containing protein|uniref:YHS domain-containing protein n=1 Tax=Novimethylophilus sp. TaxID=2137426 RepID=UPI002F428545
MEKSRNLVKDPVCGVEVPPHQHAIDYLKIPYAFCSRQCLERFLAHPHLYVGQPGHKAPRQEGRQILKRRSLRLATALDTDQTAMLAESLCALRGIKALKTGPDTLEITYDLLQVTTEQIEQKMAEIGVKLGDGWTERLRLSFVHYEEELEAGSLEVSDRNIYD